MQRKRVLPLAALMLCTPALAGPAAAVASPQTVPAPAPATAPTAAAPLRILLTNDDGYNAPGIRKAFERLTAAGHDVTIVAPLTNQSGTGTKMMSAPTITVKHPEPKVWAVDGTPGDSVAFGLSEVFEGHAPDLVVSGTNFGPNVAGLATHSGTVGGAVAALESGVPAIALSTGGVTAPDPVSTVNAMGPTVDFAVKLIDRLRARAKSGPLLPAGVGLNVNHPIVGADGTGVAAGVATTFQDPQTLLEPDFTDSGDGTWKVNVKVNLRPAAKGGDVEAVSADKIAVSPMNANWNTGPADYAATSALIAGLRP
ncbi:MULTISPECIES: 5'/3'-nucleotidase SurE [unclassified Streptomyces]|uniref:5'/3'-nucleotidase SurE n=1 Tax=unclassified Streptomyces TaxID=2593676 RepID=UPI001BE9B14F|nr:MULTISPECIES: 5'/3'-nucleotidase SurE [unclassified Streptomyces]MBT2404241.1 5'/3'-nucleotidase SurE [Streptomyces sp. ISL-21]MBT2612918.1 5'/3'-nucleotidase SurE [Streptomyces sp. ISL-87]